MTGYGAKTQTRKNLAWWLPRPAKNKYKGSMPLYCEEWLIRLAKDILHHHNPKILNVFCGVCKFGFRIDINPEVKPDLLWDIHRLSEKITEPKYDVVLADPPYSNREAKTIYGTPKLKYKIWTKECDKVLKPGGLFIIYHSRFMPPPNKEYITVKRVFIGGIPNHAPRIAIYYRKKIEKRNLFNTMK